MMAVLSSCIRKLKLNRFGLFGHLAVERWLLGRAEKVMMVVLQLSRDSFKNNHNKILREGYGEALGPDDA